MYKHLQFICTILTSVYWCSYSFSQYSNNRESIKQYNEFNKSTFIYGSNIGYDGLEKSLDADLYKPNLFSNKLPLVIMYYGGITGDKNTPSLKPFIDAITAANISVIVPNFRQGWYGSSQDVCGSATPDFFDDALYRTFQDNRALIRYCKANANALGIDSNKIFLFGVSAGGFLALHHLYYEENMAGTERVKELGSLDFQGNTNINTINVAGIISVVGGFYNNTAPIIKKTPLLLFNNTCDGAVDFFNGWLGNCSNTRRTYGPGIFTKQLEQSNNPYSLHVFCGYNHGFQSEASPEGGDALSINYISKKSIDFIKGITQNTYQFSTQIASDSVTSNPIGNCHNFETFYWCKEDSIAVDNPYFSITPNPITCLLQPKLNVRYPTDETFTVLVADETGKIITHKKIEYKTAQNIIYLDVNDFSLGISFLIIKNSTGKIIYKNKVVKYCEF